MEEIRLLNDALGYVLFLFPMMQALMIGIASSKSNPSR